MSTFTIGAAEFKNSRKSDFQEFIEIAKGRSIISAGDWSDGRFELGLSGGLMLRIFSDAPAEVNVITTVNPGEIPPLLVALGDLPQQVPLHVLEDKLRGLRTLHAVYFLLNSGRGKKLTQYLYKNPDGDIERDLLNEEDRLFVESVSYGSWILALWAKTKRAFSAVSSVAGLVFERGREAFLRRLEAEARLLENQADTESIELAQKKFDLNKSQLDYLLDITKRLDAPDLEKKVKSRILDAVESLTIGDLNDADSRKTLEQ